MHVVRHAASWREAGATGHGTGAAALGSISSSGSGTRRQALARVSAADFELYRAVFDHFFADDRRLSLPENSASPAATTTAAIAPCGVTHFPVIALLPLIEPLIVLI